MQGDSPEYEYRGDCRSNRLSCVVEPRTAAMGMGVAKRRKAAHECLDKSPMGNNFSVLHRAFIAMTRYKSIL